MIPAVDPQGAKDREDEPPDAARRALMQRVKVKNSAPEMAVRRALHALGYRYRLHDTKLPGRPDLVFPSRKVVVFVHGCFWHQHQGCRKATIPATRREFWRKKLEGNVARDARQASALSAAGWMVHPVWECEVPKNRFLVSLRELLDGRFADGKRTQSRARCPGDDHG
jgi:DNA mismatch endonuclease (patch repair protein)